MISVLWVIIRFLDGDKWRYFFFFQAEDGIRDVRAHADRFHIDPNRIALLGESASGQMVAQVASELCTGCEVQAVVSFYGVYDFTKWADRSESQRAALRRLFSDWRRETLQRYSPQFSSRPGQPPILLIQGTKDELFGGTMEYARKLKEIGAPFKLILLEGDRKSVV